MRRVDEAVREVLSDAISLKVKDPRIGFVTVTAVETAPDLRRARVYVSVLGDKGARKRSLQGLRSAHGILQRAVAGELRLKHTPTLEFVYDDTSERGMRIAELIDREAGERAVTTESPRPASWSSTNCARASGSC